MSGIAVAWNPAPAVVGTAVVVLLFFLHGFLRLRRRGRNDHAGWGRLLLFIAGLACIALPLVSPLDAAGDRYLLSAHMLEHMLMGDAGPALILLALRGPLLFFAVPAAALRAVARVAALRSALAFLLRPGTGLCIWALVFSVWHVPAVYDFALGHRGVHEIEHATYLLAGFLGWSQLVDPARRRRLALGQRLVYAGALFAFGQLLGDVLLLTGRALYPAYAAEPKRLLGLSALADQQLAGVVMMAEQLVTLGTCVLVLLFRPLRLSLPRPALAA